MSRRNVLRIELLVLLAATLCAFAGQEDQKVVIPSNPQPVAENSNTPGKKEETGGPTLQQRYPRYRLRKGDTLELNFAFNPEFNKNATVQPDGFITLKEVGDLHVEGQTTPELTQSLQAAYGEILNEPVITVELKDFEKPFFIAAGEVIHPGKYSLPGDTTVTEAVAIAGGFNDSAKHSQVLLFRRVSDNWMKVQKLNLKQMLRTGDLSEDMHLRPGDMVYVPKNVISRFKKVVPTPSVYFNPMRRLF